MKSDVISKISALVKLTNLCVLCYANVTHQGCPPEFASNGITAVWPASANGTWAVSDPQCFGNDGNQIIRYCNGSDWTPTVEQLPVCMTVMQQFDLDGCPPGYSRISENITDYCFQISNSQKWNYPCFTSGGASVITDLGDSEIDSLMSTLRKKNFNHLWLPGRRLKSFNPVSWSIPGRNWGKPVIGRRGISFRESIFSNCLYLDVNTSRLMTGSCDRLYPTLCIFVNEANFPARCPNGYHAFRFMPDKDSCYGIEKSTAILGSTFDSFVSNQCKNPMGSNNTTASLEQFVFLKLIELTGLEDNIWCWYDSSLYYNGTYATKEENTNQSIATEVTIASLQGMINNQGTLGLMNIQSRLPCMACEKNISYGNTQLSFEYNDADHKMYLTVYYPLGLWKDQVTDKGMQCFSDAQGFVKVVDIEDTPLFEINQPLTKLLIEEEEGDSQITKVVYKIEPVTDRSAQYWCEGHSKNFTFLETNKILVVPRGEDEHVFALVIQTDSEFGSGVDDFPTMAALVVNITDVLDAKQVLIMDILDVNNEYMIVLLHVHVYLGDDNEQNTDISYLIVTSYEKLLHRATMGFPDYHIKFVNMSSSTRCLPTTTEDKFTLDWELTGLGQITAPKQFCLQENGLPVTRRCGGTYLMGAVWRDVDGSCSATYEASNTTTFLYKVAKGQVSENSTAHFLTEGLVSVFDDLNIIIPADIYYLSMSFQFILKVADINESLIDMGDINNIAWIMNQVMVLDWDYLRLAQTLNSTNVIVDSISNLIEIIAYTNNKSNDQIVKSKIELAVQPKFIVQITYPAYNNITGLALVKRTESDYFTEMNIYQLNRTTKLSDVLQIDNLEIAAWVPDEVLNSLQVNRNDSEPDTSLNGTISPDDVHIVVSIFSNDAVFQEIDVTPRKINSRIIGITIPGYISNLQYPVTIVFKDINRVSAARSCGYWDFNVNDRGSAPGYWASEGCFLAGYYENFTICQCLHLTHFGQLIAKDRGYDGESVIKNASHERALNVITLVGCFLSLLGIAGIWTTAIVFHSWRKKPGTKVLLQLSGAISMPLILILLFNLDLGLFEMDEEYYQIKENKKSACILLGSLLHFSILSGFTWMLITAILQFIRYVRVFGVQRPTRFMCKLALIGWGVPLLPVVVTLIIDKDNYIPPAIPIESTSVTPICYPTGWFFYFGVIFPIAIVLIVNVVLFILVLYSISRGPDGKFRAADMDLICAQLRLSIFLFFLLGLSWIFGIFSFTQNGTLLSYLFCLTSTLQGFVLFVYFVVCDPATRLMWISLMKPQFRMSITSLTSVNN